MRRVNVKLSRTLTLHEDDIDKVGKVNTPSSSAVIFVTLPHTAYIHLLRVPCNFTIMRNCFLLAFLLMSTSLALPFGGQNCCDLPECQNCCVDGCCWGYDDCGCRYCCPPKCKVCKSKLKCRNNICCNDRGQCFYYGTLW